MMVPACAKEAVTQTSAHVTTPRMKTFVVNFIGSYSTTATEARFLLPLRTTLSALFRRLCFLDVSGKSFADKKTTIETFVRIPGGESMRQKSSIVVFRAKRLVLCPKSRCCD
jgi:hypothetical protein